MLIRMTFFFENDLAEFFRICFHVPFWSAITLTSGAASRRAWRHINRLDHTFILTPSCPLASTPTHNANLTMALSKVLS